MPSASRNGLFLGIALIIYQAILYLADIGTNSAMNYLIIVVIAAGLFLCVKQYRDQEKEGFISYGRSVGYSLLVSLFAGFISAAFIYVLYKYIDLTIIDKIILESEDRILETIKDEAQAEQAIEMNKLLITPGFIAMGVVLNVFILGLVCSLILSIFLKKENFLKKFDTDTL